MKNIRIAHRYAKALFGLSIEMDVLENVKSDMEFILNTITASDELKKFLLCPVIKDEKKIKVIKTLFDNKIQQFTIRFINLIIQKRRFLYINYIAEEFIALYRNHNNIVLASFITAKEMQVAVRDKVLGILQEFTHKDIELIEEVRKELIGGFVLKIDDKQYDNSIRTKLLRISKEFRVNIYEKGL